MWGYEQGLRCYEIRNKMILWIKTDITTDVTDVILHRIEFQQTRVTYLCLGCCRSSVCKKAWGGTHWGLPNVRFMSPPISSMAKICADQSAPYQKNRTMLCCPSKNEIYNQFRWSPVNQNLRESSVTYTCFYLKIFKKSKHFF